MRVAFVFFIALSSVLAANYNKYTDRRRAYVRHKLQEYLSQARKRNEILRPNHLPETVTVTHHKNSTAELRSASKKKSSKVESKKQAKKHEKARGKSKNSHLTPAPVKTENGDRRGTIKTEEKSKSRALLRAELGQLSELARRMSLAEPKMQQKIHNSLSKSLVSKRKEIAAAILKKYLLKKKNEAIKRGILPPFLKKEATQSAVKRTMKDDKNKKAENKPTTTKTEVKKEVKDAKEDSMPQKPNGEVVKGRGKATATVATKGEEKQETEERDINEKEKEEEKEARAEATKELREEVKKELKEQVKKVELKTAKKMSEQKNAKEKAGKKDTATETKAKKKSLKENTIEKLQKLDEHLHPKSAKTAKGLKKFDIPEEDEGDQRGYEDSIEADTPSPQYEGALPPYNGAGPEGDVPTGEIGPLGAFEPPIAEGEEDPFKGARHGEEEFDERAVEQDEEPVSEEEPQQAAEEGANKEEDVEERGEEGLGNPFIPPQMYNNFFRYVPASRYGEGPRFLPYTPPRLEGDVEVTGEKKSKLPSKRRLERTKGKPADFKESKPKNFKQLQKHSRRFDTPYYPSYYQQADSRMEDVAADRRSYFPEPEMTEPEMFADQMQMADENAIAMNKKKDEKASKRKSVSHRNFKQERDHLANLHQSIRSKFDRIGSAIEPLAYTSHPVQTHEIATKKYEVRNKNKHASNPSQKGVKRQLEKAHKLQEEEDVKQVDKAMDSLVDKIIANALGRAIIDPNKQLHSSVA